MRLWKFDSKIPNMFHAEDIYVYRKTFVKKMHSGQEVLYSTPHLIVSREITPHIENGVPFCVLHPYDNFKASPTYLLCKSDKYEH